MDLVEAPRILGGGAGLDSPQRFEQLSEIGSALGASVGATRVITDRGWVPHARQIGTTGCVIDPELYFAFGISGAVQHTAGLGQPQHIVSVNTDPHCPMMQLADLAIVCPATANTLNRLAAGLADDPVGALLLCSSGQADMTIVHGEVLVREGRLTRVELEPLIEQHNAFARALVNHAA